MRFSVPAGPFSFAWQAVWPAASTNTALYPLYRSVIIERYEDPDLVHLWATDGALLIRALVPTDYDPTDPVWFDPDLWDQLYDAEPLEQVIAHDDEKHGIVLAKSAARLAKEDESAQVRFTIGRHTPSGGQPALAPELERLQAILETDTLTVDMLAIDTPPPNWRRMEPSVDLGARVKRIGFAMNRLKRLTSVPGVGDVAFQFTSSTGAAIARFTTSAGSPLPVRGLIMPNRLLDGVDAAVASPPLDGEGIEAKDRLHLVTSDEVEDPEPEEPEVEVEADEETATAEGEAFENEIEAFLREHGEPKPPAAPDDDSAADEDGSDE